MQLEALVASAAQIYLMWQRDSLTISSDARSFRVTAICLPLVKTSAQLKLMRLLLIYALWSQKVKVQRNRHRTMRFLLLISQPQQPEPQQALQGPVMPLEDTVPLHLPVRSILLKGIRRD